LFDNVCTIFFFIIARKRKEKLAREGKTNEQTHLLHGQVRRMNKQTENHRKTATTTKNAKNQTAKDP